MVRERSGRIGGALEALDAFLWEADPTLERLTPLAPTGPILGHPPELWHRPGRWSELVHPVDRDAVLAALRRVGEGGGPRTLEHRLVDATGRARRARTDARPMTRGGAAVVAGLTVVVASEGGPGTILDERAKVLLSEAPLAVFAMDPDGKVVFCEGPLLERFAVAREELLGRMVDDLSDMTDELSDIHRRVLAGETLTKRGRWGSCWFDATYVPRRDERGRVMEVVGIALDATELERARQAVERERDLAAAVIENAGAVLVVLDGDGHIVRWNQRAAALAGVPIDAVRGLPLWDAVGAPHDIEVFRSAFAAVNDSSASIVRGCWRTPGGGYRELEWWYTPLPERAGNAGYVVGTGVDVTDQRASERELRESEARFRCLSEATFEGVTVHEHGKIMFANRAFAELYGYSEKELVGMSVLQLAPPEGYEVLTLASHTDEPLEYEAVGLRRDGTTFIKEIRSKSVPFHGRSVRVAAVRDISERRRWERELQEQVALLAATLEATADGILAADLDGHVVAWNERFLETWSIPREVVAGRSLEMVLAAARERLARPDEDDPVLAPPAPDAETATTLSLADGRRVEGSSRPQRVAGVVTGRVWSFRDVTERDRARTEILDALRARDEFLSVASHELRGPVSALRLAVQGLRERPHVAEEAEGADDMGAMLAIAERQTVRLTEQIEALLDVSRIHAQRLDLVLDDVDLVATTRQVVADLAQESSRAGSPLVLRAPEAIVGRWDRGRLEQVVTNLLSNALKFGAGRPVEVDLAADDARATLRVRDHGSGVPPDLQPVIFDRFTRGVSARHYGGLGLGLYIARRIVEALEGEISVDSLPGQGATFIVSLPRRGAAAHHGETRPEGEAEGLDRRDGDAHPPDAP